MKKITLTKNCFKFIIALETFLYGVLGLVVSSWYFANDYSDFINQVSNTKLFWVGFLVLVAIIISATLIMIGLATMFIIIVKWWNKR